MVKEDRETLIEYARLHSDLRPGFKELLDYCNQRNIDFAIISNGLDFYIESILNGVGLGNLRKIAGKTEFGSDGITVKYFGPTGIEMISGFKEAYTKLFIQQGFRVIYIGDGISDIPSAKLCYRVFARDDLLAHCSEAKLECLPFNDLHDVIKGLAGITA